MRKSGGLPDKYANATSDQDAPKECFLTHLLHCVLYLSGSSRSAPRGWVLLYQTYAVLIAPIRTALLFGVRRSFTGRERSQHHSPAVKTIMVVSAELPEITGVENRRRADFIGRICT